MHLDRVRTEFDGLNQVLNFETPIGYREGVEFGARDGCPSQ